MKLIGILILAFLFTACDGVVRFREAKILGGQKVTTSKLNLGQTTYLEYCVQCHGVDGKGNGPAAPGLLPPPRNLTQGLYKFPWTQYGELPSDEDFKRIIRQGLPGTAMLPWDISDERLDAVIQYIKTFAPETWEGEGKVIGTKFDLPKDPFGITYKHIAIEKGRKVYHITAACTQCHRGYATKAEISEWNKEINGAPMKPEDFASDLYQLKNQDGEYNYKVLPPDFTYHELRSVVDLESTVQRLMYGVTGSGMPGWKDVVADDELWALAYYVQHLREMKVDQTARKALMDKLDKQ